MKKYVLFISGALALSLVSSSTSSAWNGRAHMMVAAVAYNQLTQQTKNRVDTLLLLNPDRITGLTSSLRERLRREKR